MGVSGFKPDIINPAFCGTNNRQLCKFQNFHIHLRTISASTGELLLRLAE